MNVLFSPSETKTSLAYASALDTQSFIFPSLFDKRHEALTHYQDFLHHASLEKLQKLFGLKDTQKVMDLRCTNIFTSLTCKAIERYDGVTYDYLSYATLDDSSQSWIDSHVMIFSNLFGPLLAKNFLPEYKLQQGESLGTFKPEMFYKEQFSKAMTEWIGDAPILDLRAGFYEKFYTLKRPYLTMKFLKQGKVVSHFAKAYRGKVLRTLAREKPKSEDDFFHIAFENLRILEISQKGFKKELLCEIID
jgi:cytoplasmic iron level regulating protein YaaA (DUF328/UPF0246 family)